MIAEKASIKIVCGVPILRIVTTIGDEMDFDLTRESLRSLSDALGALAIVSDFLADSDGEDDPLDSL